MVFVGPFVYFNFGELKKLPKWLSCNVGVSTFEAKTELLAVIQLYQMSETLFVSLLGIKFKSYWEKSYFAFK